MGNQCNCTSPTRTRWTSRPTKTRSLKTHLIFTLRRCPPRRRARRRILATAAVKVCRRNSSGEIASAKSSRARAHKMHRAGEEEAAAERAAAMGEMEATVRRLRLQTGHGGALRRSVLLFLLPRLPNLDRGNEIGPEVIRREAAEEMAVVGGQRTVLTTSVTGSCESMWVVTVVVVIMETASLASRTAVPVPTL